MHNLPASLSRFIGRKQELPQLRGLFEGVRLLTLVGAGGSGKTRLALELARQLENRFPDGVCFVDFSALAEPALVSIAVARPLGIVEAPHKSVTDTLVGSLKAKRMLLLLDNCERLVHACASLVSSILQRCPDLKVVATSREALRLPGELVWTVPALTLPAPSHVRFSSLARSEAVQLFADRASSARHDFELDAGNAGVVARICRRLDGIPLSIELAAARTRLMSEDEILARLEHCLQFLTDGSRTAPSRHRTLRATIDWSHDLLTDPERALFRRFSVFAGGFTLDDAAGVCPGDSVTTQTVVDVVAALVDKSLVEPAFEKRTKTRYRLLETIREYAAERLFESAEEDLTRRRHADYFLGLAETAARGLDGPEQTQWFDRLDDEHDNLRAALDWARVAQPPLVSRLAAALGWFWKTRGHVSEGRSWLARGLTTEVDPTPLRGRLLASEAQLAWHKGDRAAAIDASAEGVDIARAGDRIALARALDLYAFILVGSSELAAARGVVAEAIKTARQAREPLLLGGTINTAGILALHLGEIDKAQRLLQRSRAIARRAGDSGSAATASSVLGWGQLRAGNLPGARASLTEALQLRLSVGDRIGLAISLDYFAELLVKEGQRERALRLIGASDRIYRDSGSVPPSLAVASRRQWLDAACKALGKGAKSILREGGQLNSETAVAEALGGPDQPPLPQPIDEGAVPELSRREREVARLVAGGLTNRVIARRLLLAERTVDAHVEHIRNKLDVRSRAQIGAWVAKHEENGQLGTAL